VYLVLAEYVFRHSLALAILIVVLVLGCGVYGVALAYALGIVAIPFLSVYFLNRILPGFVGGIKATYMRKRLFLFSWPLLFVGIVNLVLGSVDTLMIGWFSTSYWVGIYRASLATTELVWIVPSSFAYISVSVLTALYAQQRVDDLNETSHSITKWILLLVLLPVLLLITFSREILGVFGAEFRAGATALSFLAAGHLIASVCKPATYLLLAMGRTKLILLNICLGAAVNIGLNLYLIPIYNITGAAIATAASLALVDILAFLEIYKLEHWQPLRLGECLKILASAPAATYFVYLLARVIFGVAPLYALPGLFLLSAGMYFFLLLVSRLFDAKDLAIMLMVEERTGLMLGLIKRIIRRLI